MELRLYEIIEEIDKRIIIKNIICIYHRLSIHTRDI